MIDQYITHNNRTLSDTTKIILSIFLGSFTIITWTEDQIYHLPMTKCGFSLWFVWVAQKDPVLLVTRCWFNSCLISKLESIILKILGFHGSSVLISKWPLGSHFTLKMERVLQFSANQ